MRSVNHRTVEAEERGWNLPETVVEKPTRSPRASAIALQKLRTLLRQAERASSRQDFDEVERLLIQALTVEPESIEAQAQLAKVYLTVGRDAKAEAMYRELVRENGDVSFYANLGLACYKQGKYEKAVAAYGRAMELDPKSPERVATVGRACLAAKRYDDAVLFLEKAVERLSRDTELLYMLAECYKHTGNRKKVEETYQKIHRLHPYDEEIKNRLSALANA